jgi:hypothetical protein
MDENLQHPPVKPAWFNQPIPPALRMYGGIWLAIIASLCVPLLNILPGVYVFCLYFLIVLLALGLLFDTQSGAYWFIGVSLIVAIICLPNFVNITDGVGYQAGCVKQNTHSIQLALERYATDNHGLYPLNMDVLRYEAYMSKFPKNDYAERSSWAREQGVSRDSRWLEMHPLGEELFADGYTPLLEGNFVYIPDVHYDANGAPYVKDYLLMSFARGTIKPTYTSPRRVVDTPVILLTSKPDKVINYQTPYQ